MVGMIVRGGGRKGLMDILVMLSPLCGRGGDTQTHRGDKTM